MLPAQHTVLDINGRDYNVTAVDENSGVCLLAIIGGAGEPDAWLLAEDTGSEDEVRLVITCVVSPIPIPLGTYPTITC